MESRKISELTEGLELGFKSTSVPNHVIHLTIPHIIAPDHSLAFQVTSQLEPRQMKKSIQLARVRFTVSVEMATRK
jgi:hypothetical protein